ncbi:MAG: Crp/Fnr family transcriptional regulator [Rhodobacteraceae bacterium]|nr:Crp/Fnr family transcriptional regulator [Paracoccaceae bacterium]
MPVKCQNCPLRKHDLFVPMTADEIQAMTRFKVGELAVDPGTPLLMEGSNSPQLYTALHGMGLRYKTMENGRRQVINFVFPGDFLGLQAGVMAEMQHSVEATTSMLLCVFDRSELWSFFRSHPERAYDMTWACAVEDHFLGESLVTLGQRTAAERVGWAFLRIWDRLNALGLQQQGAVPMPYRQQDLADALGLSLVHTNKVIGSLRRRQIANWRDGVLSVTDRETLEDLSLTGSDNTTPPRPLF